MWELLLLMMAVDVLVVVHLLGIDLLIRSEAIACGAGLCFAGIFFIARSPSSIGM